MDRTKGRGGSKTGGNKGGWKPWLGCPENPQAPGRDDGILPKVTANSWSGPRFRGSGESAVGGQTPLWGEGGIQKLACPAQTHRAVSDSGER